jgi:glycosyltransferase involved in cell wall biosynthesis
MSQTEDACKYDEQVAPNSSVLSVIVLAHNEERCLGGLLSDIMAELSGIDYQVIVVDDGSTDKTREIALSHHVEVVSHPENLGKGAAMKSGVKAARGVVLVFMDGDGAHFPSDIIKLTKPIIQGDADLVIGSRALPGSIVPKSPLRRRLSNKLASWAISFITSFLLPIAKGVHRTLKRKPLDTGRSGQKARMSAATTKITDCTSGFRSLSKACWQGIEIQSNKFEIETEMIFEAAKNGFRILEVPIKCNWDSQSSRLSMLGDGLKTVRLLSNKLARLMFNGR